MLASWRGTRFEVSQVLREVCVSSHRLALNYTHPASGRRSRPQGTRRIRSNTTQQSKGIIISLCRKETSVLNLVHHNRVCCSLARSSSRLFLMSQMPNVESSNGKITVTNSRRSILILHTQNGCGGRRGQVEAPSGPCGPSCEEVRFLAHATAWVGGWAKWCREATRGESPAGLSRMNAVSSRNFCEWFHIIWIVFSAVVRLPVRVDVYNRFYTSTCALVFLLHACSLLHTYLARIYTYTYPISH